MRKQYHKGVVKLPPELATYKAAKQRVNTRIEATETHFHCKCQVYRHPGSWAVRVDHPHDDGGIADQVVWQIEQGKEDQHCLQHPNETTPPVVWVGETSAVAQLSDAAPAAVGDGDQGEEEADDGAAEGVGQGLPSLLQQHIEGADGAVVPWALLGQGHGGLWYTEGHVDHPGHHTQHVGLPTAHQSWEAQRVDNGEVPVHTDGGNKEDAEVEVVMIEQPHGLAQGQTQAPVQLVQMVLYEDRQGQQPGSVSQRQVEEEDGAARPTLQAVREDPEGE